MPRPVITFPIIGIDDFEFYLETNHGQSTSPFTNRKQIKVKDGTRWVISMRFNNLRPDEARLLQAFLWECDGPVGTFYLPDYLYVTKPEPATHPKVSLSSQSGKTLQTNDWPASSLVLKKGEYIEVAGQMRGVTADVTSDGTGNALIPLSHRFYDTPGVGASVNYWSPKALFMLKDNNQARRPTSNLMRSNFRLQCEEAIL